MNSPVRCDIFGTALEAVVTEWQAAPLVKGAVHGAILSGGGNIASAIRAFTLSSATGALPGGRVASCRRPSTPSARKRPHQRQIVGFDIPVRLIVSTRPQPAPSSRMMWARHACLRGVCGW